MTSHLTKTPILFIGGLAMKADEHESLADTISTNLGRRTLYFDNINVGDGPRFENSKELTISDQAVHQWNQVNEILGKESSISIYGISMGGMIATIMATIFPERVEKLVLAATSANLSHNPSVPDDLFAKWTKAKHEDDIRESTRIAFGVTTLNTNTDVYEEYFQYRIKGMNKQKSKEFIQQLNSIRNFDGKSFYSRLANIQVPISVLTGSEDILFDKTHKQDIQNLIPKATFIEFNKSGHMLHLEAFDQLNEVLVKVFSAQSPNLGMENHEV
jgi:pimeloyl-ACP methyl ester carboxylesterase